MLRWHILQYLEQEDVISWEDEGMSVLLELRDKINWVKKGNRRCNVSVSQQVLQMYQSVGENVIVASDADEQGESVCRECHKSKPCS